MASASQAGLEGLMSVTGYDRVAAQTLLDAYCGNIDAAVNGFLADGDVFTSPQPAYTEESSRSATAVHSHTSMDTLKRTSHSTSPNERSKRQREDDDDDEDTEGGFGLIGHSVGDDICSEVQASPSVLYNPLENGGVRAPDAVYSEQLLTSNAYDAGKYATHAKPKPSVFKVNPFSARKADGTLDKEMIQKQKKLAEMFCAPRENVFHGTFSAAKELASSQRKWLIVNIQQQDEFACHCVNRDLWRSEKIKLVLEKYYLLWQKDIEHPEGERFAELYPFNAFPYIAVIDPRTGAKMTEFTSKGLITEDAFVQASDRFLDSNVFPDPKSTTDTNLDKPRERKSRNVLDMDEEAQMAAAIAASLEATDSANTNGNELNSEEQKESYERLSPPPTPPNDSSKETVTNISFKMPDGSRRNRRFFKQNTVQDLYTYASAITGIPCSQFKLLQHTKQLGTLQTSTLVEADTLNSVVTIQPEMD
eukprot:CFRG7753T1